jgi:hypothetical protein
MTDQPTPFIVTVELPAEVFAWADRLRRAHYPVGRNHLHAHVTLFHAFAPSLRDELHRYLPNVAAEFARPPARVVGLMDLGRGTAIELRSEAMLAIRGEIAEHFHGALTAQDRHEPRLHVTVQNKVAQEAARALQRELAPVLEPRAFRFAGLALHLYRGGPWERLGLWRFRGKER